MNIEDGSILAKASTGNGQIRYGADVINRIIESEREGGSERLQSAVIDESLRPLIQEMCAAAGLSPGQVYRVCLAGNTSMNHLLLGLYSDPVRMEPYIPSFFHCDDMRANSLKLNVHPEARFILAPNIGSYVGGDISCGMRASDGAIDSCSIDKDSMEPTLTTIGGASQVGICGSGINMRNAVTIGMLLDIDLSFFPTLEIPPSAALTPCSPAIRRGTRRMSLLGA